MTPKDDPADPRAARELARRVRDECVRRAIEAYEAAGAAGLCGEGAFEAAIGAVRNVDVERLGEPEDGEQNRGRNLLLD